MFGSGSITGCRFFVHILSLDFAIEKSYNQICYRQEINIHNQETISL